MADKYKSPRNFFDVQYRAALELGITYALVENVEEAQKWHQWLETNYSWAPGFKIVKEYIEKGPR